MKPSSSDTYLVAPKRSSGPWEEEQPPPEQVLYALSCFIWTTVFSKIYYFYFVNQFYSELKKVKELAEAISFAKWPKLGLQPALIYFCGKLHS